MTNQSSDIIEAPAAGEQIHMPAPSILPILNAVGLSMAVVSITLSRVGLVIGILLFLVTTVIWIREARREIDELPLDHHAH